MEGYDMESVLKVVNSLLLFLILNKVKLKEFKNKVEEEFWKEIIELGNLCVYENYSFRYLIGEYIIEVNIVMEWFRWIMFSYEFGFFFSLFINEEGR